MNRSEFINLGYRAGCGLLLPSIMPSFTLASEKKKVIVVGAGAAGAMAANTLHQNGYEVIVLEARNRVGGRISTNLDWGVSLELGANWISYASDPTNLVTPLVDKVGLKTSRTSYSNVKIFDLSGNKISKIGTGLTGIRTENRVYKFFENKDVANEDLAWGHAIDSVMNYESGSNAKKARLDILKLGNSVSAGSDSYGISGYGYGTYDADQKDDEQLVLNGYNRIIKHLLNDIEVRLNQKVVEVEDHGEEVSVTSENNKYVADFLIITVPVSLLQQKKIRFVPELPESKQISFDKMPMGLFNKAFMEFSEKFWQGDPHFFAFQKKVLKNSGIVFNYHAYSANPILVAFHVGESGKWLENNSNAEIKKHWQEIFAKAYPGKNIEFAKLMTSKWFQDPFAKGSYSSIGIGTSATDVQNMARPVGRIHFAGEATSYHGHGYVHGAMESGLREAKRIMTY